MVEQRYRERIKKIRSLQWTGQICGGIHSPRLRMTVTERCVSRKNGRTSGIIQGRLQSAGQKVVQECSVEAEERI